MKLNWFVFFLHLVVAKKGSKLTAQLQNQGTNYKKVVVLHYGTAALFSNVFDQFVFTAKHFEYTPKHLNHCNHGLKDEPCLDQLHVELKKLDPSTIVTILNHDYSFMNVMPEEIIKIVSNGKSAQKILTNIDARSHGLNLFGIRENLMDFVEKCLKDKMLDLSGVSIDHLNKIFASFDKVGVQDIGVSENYGKDSIWNERCDGATPIILSQKKDFFRYIINLLESGKSSESKEVAQVGNLDDLEDLHVCLNVPTVPLFLEEFFEGFFAQDYPKDKMVLQIVVNSQDLVAKVQEIMDAQNIKSYS